MSIGVYVLAGAWRTQLRSNEAAMKYFLLGAFATGFLLYGIALIYGATGFFPARSDRRRDSRHQNHTMLITGVAMLIVAFGFKVAAVPFHMWTPDVYEGAPTTVTALHGGRREGRRVRGVRADLPARASAVCTPTGRCCSGDRRAHDDGR